VSIRELVRNSLRMRPDRIIVGEVRGAEALDMLQAMNTGHDGSLRTVHANTPRDALSRLETMVLMAGYDLPLRAIRQQVAAALDVVVQIERMSDGSRRVTAITEVQRMEADVVTMQSGAFAPGALEALAERSGGTYSLAGSSRSLRRVFDDLWSGPRRPGGAHARPPTPAPPAARGGPPRRRCGSSPEGRPSR
jgi:hypothetical protein